MPLNEPLHPDAVAITAFRALPDGRARSYTVTEFPDDPWGAISCRVRRAVGHIRPSGSTAAPYAVLDVLDATDDIVQDFEVPNARSWRYVAGKFGFRVDDTAAR